MKLSIPTNFDDDFFDRVDLSAVAEIFGKLDHDAVGGGRSSSVFHRLPRRRFQAHVREITRRGIAFNYLLNATCMNNREMTRKGHREIRKLLDFIQESGCAMVTVGLPQLIELIKAKYPALKVSVTTNVMADCLERVRYWEELGADQITVSYADLNRNFKELRRIMRYAKIEVQTIANLVCRRHCPYQTLHGNYHSHASQTGNTEGYAMDYYCNTCIARFFTDTTDIIKSGWIRPEDLHYYEALGMRKIKLVERGITTEALARIVKAYTEQRYDGNFFDLLPSMSKYKVIVKSGPLHALRHFVKPGKVNLRRLWPLVAELERLKDYPEYYTAMGVYMDNRTLDGFLDRFLEKSCGDTVCEECNYCAAWAKKAITRSSPPPGFNPPEETMRKITTGFATGDLL